MVILIYLAIVLLSVTQSASTKLFNRRSSNSSVFNTTKALSSFVLFFLMALGGFEMHLPTLFFGWLYGAFLCLSMYTGYKALCLGPMALTSMLVSFSIILPLIWGVTFGNEHLSILRIIALLLLFVSIILTNADKIFGGDKKWKSDNRANVGRGKWMLYVGMTFLCNGGCSILQKQHQVLYPNSYSSMFMFFAMLLCTIIFSAIALSRNTLSEIKATKGKWLGVISGVANGGAAFFTLILAGAENASVLFPIISAGTLLGAILCGRLLFKEKLRVNHYFALGFGMLAVVLMKL